MKWTLVSQQWPQIHRPSNRSTWILIGFGPSRNRACYKVKQPAQRIQTGWWFQPLWKILVSRDDSLFSIYIYNLYIYEKIKYVWNRQPANFEASVMLVSFRPCVFCRSFDASMEMVESNWGLCHNPRVQNVIFPMKIAIESTNSRFLQARFCGTGGYLSRF